MLCVLGLLEAAYPLDMIIHALLHRAEALRRLKERDRTDG